MSTAAKIIVYDEDDEEVFAINRTHDGYPSSAGADLLRALYRNPDHTPGTQLVALRTEEDEPASLWSRLQSPDTHTLIEPDEERALYHYTYRVRYYPDGHVMIAVIPRDGETEIFNIEELRDHINAERERENGRLMLMNLRGSGWSLQSYIDEYGRETGETASPVVTDDVATWVDPDTGELAGRSLLAKEPRITINGENEPTPHEMAVRDGVRAEIDWQGQQAVTEDGTVINFSDEQMTELARAYKSLQSLQRRVA